MQHKPSTVVAATKYGKEVEPVAFNVFTKYFRLDYKNTSVSQTGFNVSVEFPHLDAIPDGVVSCSCHKKALLEIKCSLKYRNGLSGWDLDTGVPVPSNGCMDEEHAYYYRPVIKENAPRVVAAHQDKVLFLWCAIPRNNIMAYD